MTLAGPSNDGLPTRLLARRVAALGARVEAERWRALEGPLRALLGHGSEEARCAALERQWRRGGLAFDLLAVLHSGLDRHPEQLDLIAEQLLPALWASGPAPRIWSAGCARGEEAWSLTALCAIAARGAGRGSPEVVATELSARALEAARAGRYELPIDGPGLREGLRRELFGSQPDGVVTVRGGLRASLRFVLHDLAALGGEPPEGGAFDLILCRNVLYHLSDEGRRRAESMLIGALAPGGVLLLGPTERLAERPGSLQLELWPELFVYRHRALGEPR